jgi:F0F1-type ATP synthase assembly protein I
LTQQDDEGERGGQGRRGARVYQAALEAVFSIPIAGGLGWWADRTFGTDPILVLVGLVLGFASFVLRLVRLRKLVEEQSRESSQEERDEP